MPFVAVGSPNGGRTIGDFVAWEGRIAKGVFTVAMFHFLLIFNCGRDEQAKGGVFMH